LYIQAYFWTSTLCYWKWRHHISPKHQYPSKNLYGVTVRKTAVFTINSVRTL
jgi:hypothetical protein